MTQREQYGFQQQPCVVDPRPRTPGKTDDSEMIDRLTDKAIVLAAEFGMVIGRRDARQRAMENLAWARAEIAKVTK